MTYISYLSPWPVFLYHGDVLTFIMGFHCAAIYDTTKRRNLSHVVFLDQNSMRNKNILDHKERKSQLRPIYAMLGFRDIAQFVKGQRTFVQVVKFSNCSDVGLKFLHVIQGAIKR